MRILFTSTAGLGHFYPLLPMMRAARSAGDAAGTTNADAATRLHVSARTVEHHVARLLVKLGAANRTELRPWVDARP